MGQLYKHACCDIPIRTQERQQSEQKEYCQCSFMLKCQQVLSNETCMSRQMKQQKPLLFVLFLSHHRSVHTEQIKQEGVCREKSCRVKIALSACKKEGVKVKKNCLNKT